jgi:hypothetical protein
MLTLGHIVDRDNYKSDGHDNDPDHRQVPGIRATGATSDQSPLSLD